VTLIYPYSPVRMGCAVPSLFGRSARPRPLVTICVIGPTDSWVRDALLDTGADDSVFPELAARFIGLDLTNAPVGSATGVAASPVVLRYAVVALRLAVGRVQHQWNAWVGFTSAPLRQPLLGFAGCLQFFDANFRGAREEVELAVNANYSGT
jgi:hypothetical protein